MSEPQLFKPDASLERNIRVLIADDEPINRRYLQELLSAEGLAICSVVDGLEAVEACSREVFDLLLLDYRMPRLDGLEALQRIRADPLGRNRATLAVVLTAETQAREHARLVEAGFARCVLKPARAEPLLALIAELLAHAGCASARNGARPLLDQTQALSAANNNPQIVKTLRAMLLVELETVALNPLQSLDVAALHRLRGACHLTGARRLEASLLAYELALTHAQPEMQLQELAKDDLQATLLALRMGSLA